MLKTIDKALQTELEKLQRQSEFFLQENCPVKGMIAMPPDVMMNAYLALKSRDLVIEHFISRIEQVMKAAQLQTNMPDMPFESEFKILHEVIDREPPYEHIWKEAVADIYDTLNEQVPGWDD